MSHHGTKSENLIAYETLGGNTVEPGILFGIPKDGFLRSPSIVKQNGALRRCGFIGNNDLVIVLIIPGLKEMQLQGTFDLFLSFFAGKDKTVMVSEEINRRYKTFDSVTICIEKKGIWGTKYVRIATEKEHTQFIENYNLNDDYKLDDL